MAPVGAGLCKYESLIDGTLDLSDVARMNDYLACKADNEELAQAAQRNKNG